MEGQTRKPGARLFALDAACAIAVACMLFSFSYEPADALAYIPDDAYQSQADAFLDGRLALVADTEKIFMDTVPKGDDVHVVWGPFPAVVYAFLDIPGDLMGLRPFPKAGLYFLVAIAHLLLFTALARRFLGGPAWTPRLAAACYAFSYPFWYVANEATRVSYVSVLFGSTLFLGGFLFFMRAARGGTRNLDHALSGLLLGLAFLSRVTFAMHLCVIATAVILLGGPRKRLAAFLIPATAAAAAQFAFNLARFGDPLQFGEAWIYQGRWEETITTRFLLPFDPVRYLAQVAEALLAFVGAPEPGWTTEFDTLYQYHRTYIGILALPALAALAAALPEWFRKARDHASELAGLSIATACIAFYVLLMDEFEIRYQMDYLPILFLAAFGAVSLASDRWTGVPPAIAAAALALSMPVLHFGLAGRIAQAHEPSRPVVSQDPHRMDAGVPGMFFFTGNEVGSSIRCRDIGPVHSSASGLPDRQEKLDRLGIFRFPGDRCEMLFFSGGTLRLDPAGGCRIELFLDPVDIDDCSRITLFSDGVPAGRMEPADTDRQGQMLCTRRLPDDGERLIQAYLLFDPVPRRAASFLTGTRRYGMFELRAVCGGGHG